MGAFTSSQDKEEKQIEDNVESKRGSKRKSLRQHASTIRIHSKRRTIRGNALKKLSDISLLSIEALFNIEENLDELISIGITGCKYGVLEVIERVLTIIDSAEYSMRSKWEHEFRNKNGYSILESCSFNHYPVIVNYILKNHIVSRNETSLALIAACDRKALPESEADAEEVVKLLLIHGADIKFTSINGKSALAAAVSKTLPTYHNPLVNILLKDRMLLQTSYHEIHSVSVESIDVYKTFGVNGADGSRDYIDVIIESLRMVCGTGSVKSFQLLYEAYLQEVGHASLPDDLINSINLNHRYLLLKYLVDQYNINPCMIKDNSGRSALHHFAEAGDIECIRMLVEAFNPDLFDRDFTGMTALMLACRIGHLEVVEYIIETSLKSNEESKSRLKRDINEFDLDGNGSLHWACMLKSHQLLRLIIPFVYNPNCINSHGESCLQIAIVNEDELALELLLMAGCIPQDPRLLYVHSRSFNTNQMNQSRTFLGNSSAKPLLINSLLCADKDFPLTKLLLKHGAWEFIDDHQKHDILEAIDSNILIRNHISLEEYSKLCEEGYLLYQERINQTKNAIYVGLNTKGLSFPEEVLKLLTEYVV